MAIVCGRNRYVTVIFETMFDKFSNTLLSPLKRRNKKATCFKIKLQEYLCSMQVGCKKKKIFCDNLSLKDFSSLTSSLSVELLSAGGSQWIVHLSVAAD